MRKQSTLILIAFLIAVTSLSAQQKRGPSTPEERTKAVQFAHDLENNPLGPQAKSEREWLLRWVMDVPDITVAFCPQILGTEPSDKQPYGTEIRTQLMFSQAAFLIENPDKTKDDLAIQTAGVNGSLKSTSAFSRTIPMHAPRLWMKSSLSATWADCRAIALKPSNGARRAPRRERYAPLVWKSGWERLVWGIWRDARNGQAQTPVPESMAT